MSPGMLALRVCAAVRYERISSLWVDWFRVSSITHPNSVELESLPLDQWPNTEGFMSLLFYLFVAGLKLTIQFSLTLNFRSFPPPPLKDITYLTCVHCHTWFY